MSCRSPATRPRALSDRVQILRLMAAGLTLTEIGDRWPRAKTVSTYHSQLLRRAPDEA
ncbi:MAG: hypothetical protein U0361_17965 [Nitrospiraceae bacterium]